MPSLAPEDIAYWFFRLNGCLTIRNFLVHPDQAGGQRTDADLIAVRFPFRQELDMVDHRSLGELTDLSIMFAEIKSSGYSRLNGPWTDPRARNLHRVLQAVGAVAPAAVEGLAAELYATGGAKAAGQVFRMVAVAERTNPQLAASQPFAMQFEWTDILGFVRARLVDYAGHKSDHQQWEWSGQRLYDLAVRETRDTYAFEDAIVVESGLRIGRDPRRLDSV